jgi:AmmeMemoRadiSam system protein B
VKIAWIFAAVGVLAFAASACKKNDGEKSTVEGSAEVGLVKTPNVAGTFYPADAAELAATVKGFLEDARASERAEDVVAIITPHAGYPYSGAVAATAFRQLEGRHPATVVLLGPSHYCASPSIAAGTYDGYETPLGVARVDGEFVAAVAERCADVTYTNVPFAREHCLEVQLPFVQTLFPEARVAPFIFCRQDPAATATFGGALDEVAQASGGDVVVVATCDLSHYHPYDEAVVLDRAFVRTLESFDEGAVFAGEETGEFEIDAPGVVAATLRYAKARGATKAVALECKNSGDVTGDASGGVVGYIAAAVMK